MLPLNVITLFEQERLQGLLKQCNEQEIAIDLWEGIIEHTEVKTNISQAHKQIIRHAKNKKWDKVVIAEDDLLFSSTQSFSYFVNSIPDDYFDIYFGGLSGGFIDTQDIVHNFSGLFFYCVHSRFYDTFLSADETKNIDRWLAYTYYKSAEAKPIYRACNPLVAKTINGYSAHHDCELEFDNYWKPYKYLV